MPVPMRSTSIGGPQTRAFSQLFARVMRSSIDQVWCGVMVRQVADSSDGREYYQRARIATGERNAEHPGDTCRLGRCLTSTACARQIRLARDYLTEMRVMPGTGGHARRILGSEPGCTVVRWGMNLPVNPPVLPMLANRVSELPPGEGWIFEPKWDGFRTLVFRDGDELFIQSRDEKPLDRYFPELVEALKAQLPERCVLDGEIVIAIDGCLDFEALQLRLHPAASRVKLLAVETPASIVFFDLLCEGDRNLCKEPFSERRAVLEGLLANATAPLHVTPATRDRDTAADWFGRFEGAGLDGVIAKSERGTYEPNKRVMLKVKHERDCDCVVAGFRWHKNGNGTSLGSMLLGLLDDDGNLHH